MVEAMSVDIRPVDRERIKHVREIALLRGETFHSLVNQYEMDMERGDVFPPIIVYTADDETYFLSEGHHRLLATPGTSIRCEVRSGSERDAILNALGANATHGRARSGHERRRAIELALKDPEAGQWSSRKIAELCHCSHTLVDRIRKGSTGNGCQLNDKRTGRDGRTRRTKPNLKLAKALDAGPTLADDPVDVPPVDRFGKPMTPEIAEGIGLALDFADLQSAIQAVRRGVKELVEQGVGIHIGQQLDIDLKNAWAALKFAAPHCVCIYCGGKNRLCKSCKGKGWMPRGQFDRAPESMKP